MTLIKSLLLGSAAGIVAVAAAQAADLPTRKGPVAAEYVRVCSITVAGAPVVGFVLPGSDTCFKISGYITGQIEGGNVKTGNAITTRRSAAGVSPGDHRRHRSRPARSSRNSFGFTTRFNLTFDAVSNTAYGPLVAHGEYQFNHGEGFDNTGRGGSDGGLNRAYVTWAGLTAGKVNSFFSFTGGGLAWANFFSPDRKGFNQPDLLAYTASFGGGFSATISIESRRPGSTSSATCRSGNRLPRLGDPSGTRFPTSSALWTSSRLGARRTSAASLTTFAARPSTSPAPRSTSGATAIDAGVSFNIPNMAGAMIGLTGAWSQNAITASGLPDGMWGENGAVNGNGQAMALGDAFYNGARPRLGDPDRLVGHRLASGQRQVSTSPGSLVRLVQLGNGRTAPNTSPLYNSKSFIVGGVAHYAPVKNLDFEFELLYQSTTSSQPTGYVIGNGVTTTNAWQRRRTASPLASKSPARSDLRSDLRQRPGAKAPGLFVPGGGRRPRQDRLGPISPS